MNEKIIPSFYPASQEEWRQWLEENHHQADAVWVILYKKSSGVPTLAWSNAVDEALCFGWIDSVRRPVDGEKFMQYFGKRKATSTWSKINKEKVENLIRKNQMTTAGLKCIEIAKENGSWTILDTVEDLIIPIELDRELEKYEGAKEYFESLSKSVKKRMLSWIALAKRPETRDQRIHDIATHAHEKRRPKQIG